MKRFALQLLAGGGFFLGAGAVTGWAVNSSYPGTMIMLATVSFIVSGIAFGRLEQRQ